MTTILEMCSWTSAPRYIRSKESRIVHMSIRSVGRNVQFPRCFRSLISSSVGFFLKLLEQSLTMRDHATTKGHSHMILWFPPRGNCHRCSIDNWYVIYIDVYKHWEMMQDQIANIIFWYRNARVHPASMMTAKCLTESRPS
jgi:hypothetical protein